jgi:mycothiol synthase
MTTSTSSSQSTATFFLRPGVLDDLPELVAMFNACARETSGRDEFELEDYRNEWTDPSIDLAADTRVARTPEGKIVGCIELWNATPCIECWIWARVHPAFRGQGIGTALMGWAERRARVAIERAPANARVIMTTASISTHQPTIDLLADRGFRAVRHALTMARDLDGPLPAPVWPAGITVRTMLPGEELAVYRASDESFKDHWGHVDVPKEQGFALWKHRTLDDPRHDPSLWFLAIDGDEIAGLSLCDAQYIGEPDMGWVNTLGVRRPWRRRGLAQALLYHSFGELHQRGRRKVGLGVDASSLTGATQLYEKVGMRAIQQFIRFEKELRPGRDLTTQTVEA